MSADDALRDFIHDGLGHVAKLVFELRQDDIDSLPPDVKLALTALEGWYLKAKSVVAGLDPQAEVDLSQFERIFPPPPPMLRLVDREGSR